MIKYVFNELTLIPSNLKLFNLYLLNTYGCFLAIGNAQTMLLAAASAGDEW